MKSAHKENFQHTYISNFVAAVLKITEKNAIKFDECFTEQEALKSYSLQQHISPSVQNNCMRFIHSFPNKHPRLFIEKWLYECRYCWYGKKGNLVDLYRISRQMF